MPVRAAGRASGSAATAATAATAGEEESTRRTWDARAWLRRGRRIAIDLAMVLAVMTAAPILIASVGWGRYGQQASMAGVRTRIHAGDAVRPFGIASDPSITPMQAGLAFNALQPDRQSAEFRIIEVPHPAAPWRNVKLRPDMFPTARPVSFEGPSTPVLEAAGRGFSQDEMAYLRLLATAPVWREFDIVARAPSIDIIGGQFTLPFNPASVAWHLPISRFAATKEMAYAAVDRAAYHVAMGRRDSAETILRSIVSFGFNIEDNGSGNIDQLIGRVIVGIGRDALEHFYVMTKDPRAAAVRAAQVPVPLPLIQARTSPITNPRSVDEARQLLLAQATDPKELRGIRFESLELLSLSSCTNVRELLFGPRGDVRAAFEQAKRDLARFPSEQAYLDLIPRSPRFGDIDDAGPPSPVRQFLVGTSAIAGAVLHNPRLAACTSYATEGPLIR